MTFRTTIAVLASFAAGSILTLAATDALARPARTAAPSAYANGVYGFSLIPPVFDKAEKDTSVNAAMFFGPARNGFSPNLGVMIQSVKMTLDEYAELSLGQFKEGKFKVTSDTRLKVSGRPAVLWEYEGKPQGIEMKFMALAVVDGDRILLVTGTSKAADYEALSKEFKASLVSVKFQD